MTNNLFQTQRFAELLQWYETLRKGSDDSLRIYALVDGALNEGIFRLVTQREASWRSLYPETMLEAASPAVGPYLVALKPEEPEHAALMKSLLRHTQDIDVALWIISSRPLAELSAYLHQYAEVGLPDRRRALFRYYDPSILEVLLRVLTPEERAHFLAPFIELRYWRDGWQAVPGSDLGVLPPVPEDGWTLTAEQHEKLAAGCLAETLYFEIRKELLPPMSGVDSRVGIRHVRNLLERAVDRHHLKNHDDLTAFALVGLNVNPAFDDHPIIAAKLDPQQRSKESLSNVFSTVDEAVWAQLLQANDSLTASTAETARHIVNATN